MTPSQAPLPLFGTWKLVSCESSHPELPHPTSGITTFTQEDDAIHYSSEGIWSDGRTTTPRAILRLDGSWYPVMGSLLADSLSLERMVDGSYEAKMRRDGADVGTNRTRISADGQIMTSHWEIIGPDDLMIVWDTMSERE